MPFNSEPAKEYIKLWRSVLILALRDACESKKEADKIKSWSDSLSCKMVCSFANISYDIVKKKLNQIADRSDDDAETLLNLSYFKSTANAYKKTKPKGSMYNEII